MSDRGTGGEGADRPGGRQAADAAADARAAAALAAAERIAAEPGIDVDAFGRRLKAELADIAEPGWDEVLFSGPETDVALELHRIAAQATAAAARERQYDMGVVRQQLELVRLGRSLHDERVAPAGTYGSAVSPEAVAFWRRLTGAFRGRGGRRRQARRPASAAARRRAARIALWIGLGVVVAGAGTGAAFAIAGQLGEPATVAVPRVAGLTAAQAQQKLLDLGLISGGQQLSPVPAGSKFAVGTVIGTQPPAGTRVAPGSIVMLLVAGQPLATPNATPDASPTAGPPTASEPPSSPVPSGSPSAPPTSPATPRSTPTATKSSTPKPTATHSTAPTRPPTQAPTPPPTETAQPTSPATTAPPGEPSTPPASGTPADPDGTPGG